MLVYCEGLSTAGSHAACFPYFFTRHLGKAVGCAHSCVTNTHGVTNPSQQGWRIRPHTLPTSQQEGPCLGLHVAHVPAGAVSSPPRRENSPAAKVPAVSTQQDSAWGGREL